eukprot:scaffold47449_cov21-Cyclotella_meneghiniana.AAC.1
MQPHPPRRSCGYSTMPPPRITPLAGSVNVFFGLRRDPSSVLPRLSSISSTADAITLSRAAGLTALQPRLWLRRAAAVNSVAEEGIMCSGSVGPSSATTRHSFTSASRRLRAPSPRILRNNQI